MSLFRIVFKNLRQRALSSWLTSLSIALGVAVVVAMLTLKAQSKEGFAQSAFGYDLVVGPKASALQLVLNTVFHMDQSPGNIPYPLYKELAANPRVSLAAPVAVGDTYQGFRLVGTSDRFLTDFEIGPGQKLEFESGGVFKFSEQELEHLMTQKHDAPHHDDDVPFQAVVGSIAAQRSGLKVGSTFKASHGVETTELSHEHEEFWTVTGVLKPSGTPSDRAIYINLESFFAIKGHAKVGEEGRGAEISAVVVRAKNGIAASQIAFDVNRRTDAMAVFPTQVVNDLFALIGQVDVLLLAVSILVILVAGLSILVSIYNSMSDRKRAIAIMRALGSRRSTIFKMILLEAATLCTFGGLAGLLAGHAIAEAAGVMLKARAGVRISGWAFSPQEAIVIGGLVVLGVLVGILPAVKAYRTDIVEGLNPTV